MLPSEQSGILDALPPRSRYLTLQLRPGAALEAVPAQLLGLSLDDKVVGLGATLLAALEVSVPGARPLQTPARSRVPLVHTPADLWIWLRGTDEGALLFEQRRVCAQLSAFELSEVTSGFIHREGRDLSGFVDGTENPTGDAAREAALVQDAGLGLNGSSFVVVQRWQHDLEALDGMSSHAKEQMIGRTLEDDVELEDPPSRAHVARVEQDNAAFILRRSMPYLSGEGGGLVFVAFCAAIDQFEMLMARMVGADDEVVDAIFDVTRPKTSAAFWCPPQAMGKLDLSALVKPPPAR